MAQPRRGGTNSDEAIFRIAPYYYIHILDQNTNVTRIDIGPKTYIRQDNERLVITELCFQGMTCIEFLLAHFIGHFWFITTLWNGYFFLKK